MSSPAIEVQFTLTLERESSLVTAFGTLCGTSEREVELRASVQLSDGNTEEPVITPIDVAVWQDALGPELAFGARNDLWVGAEEAAIEAALEQLAQQATRETAALLEAS